MTDNSRYTRYPAKRVFASEFKDATRHVKDGDDDYAPKFLVLPTGERANRVFMSGTLMDVEDVGNDSEYWRARIIDNSDPDGGVEEFYCYAGEHNGDAMQFFKTAETPSYIAVVGKPNTFENDNGDTLVNVRPETVKEIDRDTRNAWLTETASHTIQRLQNFAENRGSDEDAVVAEAVEAYGQDVSKYRDGVLNALEQAREEAEAPEQ